MNHWDSSPFMRFFGGRNLLYILGLLLIIGINILVYTKVSFIFHPFVVLIETIALPSVLAIIAYYLLRPLVGLLEKKVRINRIVAIAIVMIAVAGVITLLIFLIIPFLQRQITSLVEELPQLIMQVADTADQWLRNSMFAGYYNDLASNVDRMVQNFVDNLSSYLGQTLEGVTGFISQLTSIVIAIVTLPFILFYLLKDGKRLPRNVLGLLPPKMRPDVREVFQGIDHQLGSYIVGQILVSFSIGVMMYIGFVIIGLDYSLLLAAIASVTSVVPYLGPTIAITPALIIAIVTGPFMLFKLIIVWTIVQLLEGKLISPQIMGKRLHVHPVSIIFILLTAGDRKSVV